MNILLSRQFRYFIKAMETRCLNKAAEELCITRSPLGKILSEMERSTGEKLFIRKYNELLPTEAAVNLYSRIRPLYDTLKSLEDEFLRKEKLSNLNVYFDLTVSPTLCKRIESNLEQQSIKTTTQRVDLSAEKFDTLLLPANNICISYREHCIPSFGMSFFLPDESLVMAQPDTLKKSMVSKPEIMNNIPLIIGRDKASNRDFLGAVRHALKVAYPALQVIESEDDIVTRLCKVANGKGMVLMNERLSNMFSIPGIHKEKIPNFNINLGVFFNKKISNTVSLERLKIALEDLNKY